MSSMLRRGKFLFSSLLLLCMSVSFFLFHVVVSTIPLGSKLSVEGNNLWISPNGDFAIGFFNHSDQPNQYSVGIRLNSKLIPVHEQTVVWVAGADVTVGNKSYFQLSSNGELVLVDSLKGVPVWTSKTSEGAVVSALLRNDGNLVLLNAKNDVVWQSFDNPSDTLLPGQHLPVHKTLRAASRNSVSSYYSLLMNASGQLQLKFESNVIYWSKGSSSSLNISAVLTSGGALQLVDQDLGPVWNVFGEDHNDNVTFRLLRLDIDGNLRIYSWVEATRSWRSVWQAVDNQCNVFATCGERGICVFNASGSPECHCPFMIASNPNSKCFAHNCESDATGMVTFPHTFLYGIYPPNDSITITSLRQCKDLCMEDPICTATTFINDGTAQCRMKTSPYFSGHSDPSLSSISFVKKCLNSLDPLAVDPNVARSSTAISPVKLSHGLCIPCLIGAASGTFLLFVVVQLGIGYFIYRKRNRILKKAALAYTSRNSKGLMILPLAEIKDITGNFKHQIGPKMYRGVLPSHQPVAVKELETSVEERKFRAAVSKVGNIHHKNLVKLNGYCCELGHRFLVYEYVKNGSVDEYIEDDELSKRLTWRRRVHICLTMARAICYLHTECREFVCHGNLKCQNIMLDKAYEAKVSEYGLGMLHPKASYGGEKDVEDFGKMVLILVTGCREFTDVCEWTYEEWIQGHPEKVVDKRLDEGMDLQELERLLRIAFWCLQKDEHMRPSMGEVVKVLEGTLTVDPPPPPFACRRLSSEEESLESGSKLQSPTEP